MEVTIEKILSYLDEQNIEYSFIGNKDCIVKGFSSLINYCKDSIVWIKHQENIPAGFKAESVLLAVVQEGVNVNVQNAILCNKSKATFFSIIDFFFGNTLEKPAVGKGTYLSKDVRIGNNVKIGHNCTIDGKIYIDDGTIIWNNVTIINNVKIGKLCEIQSGAIIGHDGYGYYEDENHNKTMIKHYGGVDIGDNVYIGPNTVIDRGTIDDTTIGKNCKIDGLCFIAHNVILKENVSLITGSSIYGSTQIGKNTYVATATIRNQKSIGANVVIGMGSVVTNNIEEGNIVYGVPAKKIKKR